jgi:hypothetical protein
MAVKGKTSVKSAKPRGAKAAASLTLNEIAVSGVDAGAAGTALNTADAVYRLLLSIKPRALSPQEVANQLVLPLGVVTNDLIFLIGVRLVTSAPNDPTRFVAV